MNEDDLLSEMGAAIARLMVAEREDPKAAAWLARAGLSAVNRMMAGGFGVASASLDRQRDLWTPVADGERVFVTPVWDGPACELGNPCRHPSPLIDLVAYRPTEPHRLYSQTGAAALVGIEGMNHALDLGEPLRLHRSLEDFVRHGGENGPEGFAAVLIDPEAAWWALDGLSEIIADNLDHAEAIAALIEEQRPVAPTIRIPIAALEMKAA